MDVATGPLDHIVVTPSQATATAGTVQRYTVDGFDVAGNHLNDLTAVSTFSISPNGTCVANSCGAVTAGPHQITVNASGKTGSAILAVVAGPTDHVVVSPSPASAGAGAPVTFTVTGVDAFGNTTGDLTSRAVLTPRPDGSCTGASCTFTTTGPHTVTVTVDTFTATVAVAVAPGPRTGLIVTPATASRPAGVAQAYSVQGVDAFGNSTGDVTAAAVLGITPNGTCTGASCVATVAGPHVVTVTVGTQTSTASLQIVAGPVQALVVTGPARMAAGASQPFTAQGTDAFGNPTGDLTGIALFSIAPNGACVLNICGATVAGPHTVTAVVGLNLRGTASVNVTAAGPVALVVSPDGIKLVVDQPQAFTVTGVDAFGNSLGDLTAVAVFSIDPEGSCVGNVCTLTKPGNHTVTATVGALIGQANVIGSPN
jgi:hypothetical protein